MSPELPQALRQASDRLLDGVGRKGLAERSRAISDQYRKGGGSAGVVTSAGDATAYVLTRLPATYAACAHAMSQARKVAPGFAPRSLLDAGAGPGGASWAATETWPEITSATFLDSNPSFLDMASRLAAQGPAALRGATRLKADLAAPGDWPTAELVTASYALAEIPEGKQATTVAALWAATEGVLILVEPGTPAGFARLRAARALLLGQGATVLAPCPHEADCPMAGEDWCHFVQRLPRSRDHRLAKGAEVPFEDEKFSYLAAARPGVAAGARGARVLAPPRAGKPGIDLKLCGPQGLEQRFVGKRDKAAHQVARRLGWGDSFD